MSRSKNALELVRGDRIKIAPGRFETVTRRTTKDKKHPTVIRIYTTGGTTVTTLPCRVELEGEKDS